MTVRLKRAYAPAEPGDGFRILVDRLWPRGLTRESAHVDLWLKDIAPSSIVHSILAMVPVPGATVGSRH